VSIRYKKKIAAKNKRILIITSINEIICIYPFLRVRTVLLTDLTCTYIWMVRTIKRNENTAPPIWIIRCTVNNVLRISILFENILDNFCRTGRVRDHDKLAIDLRSCGLDINASKIKNT